jgi:hypothetical protein
MGVLPPEAILKRAYFSSWHLNSAIILLDKVADLEKEYEGENKFDVNHASSVVASIMSSVAYIEASINEIYQDVVDDHDGEYTKPIKEEARKKIKEKWDTLERKKILEKYQKALKFSDTQTFNKGESPYQDARLAILLRNELVHYKPKTFGGGTQHDFEQKLEGKFELNPLILNPEEPFFPDRCLGRGCAEWVLKSCLSFADEFFKRMDITPNYQRLNNRESWYSLDRFRQTA